MTLTASIEHLSTKIITGLFWRKYCLNEFRLHIANDGDVTLRPLHFHIDTISASLLVHSNLSQSDAPCERVADNHFECEIVELPVAEEKDYLWSVRSALKVDYDLVLTVDPHNNPVRASYHFTG